MGWPKRSFHSLCAAAWCALVVVCAQVALAQDDAAGESESADASVPVAGYKATVQSENVYLRSGPSFGFYPTEKIKRGQMVEVYRTAPGGWVGIRPLETSYCWLPASAVERDADDETLARVIDRPVEAWIGSNVERVKRHESQVVLEPGEEVIVLGERASEGDEPWLKIAPPRGEFRWVHSKHLSNKSPKQLADDDARKEVNRAKQLIETGVAPNTTELPVSNWHDRRAAKTDALDGDSRQYSEDQQYIEDESLEQAAFGDGIKRVGKQIRESYLGQRIFGRGGSPQPSGDRFDVGEEGVAIGKSTSGSTSKELEIGSSDEEDAEFSSGRSAPRDSTYGKDETRPYPGWAKRRHDETSEPEADSDDRATDRKRVDLSPAGEKKEPDWVQANRKRTGSAVPREDRLGARDRSADRTGNDRLASNRKDGNRTPKEREFNGYDDDDALTVSPTIERGLEELDRELTIMASRDPSAWDMGALREYGEKLLSRSRTPLERGRVRLVLDRIAAFESTAPESGSHRDWRAPGGRSDTSVAARPDRSTAPRSQDSSAPAGDIFQPPQTSPRKNSAPEAQPTFDGVGQLMPVYDFKNKGLPPYQLVDADGNFLRYVTPEPGVNLHRYERKQVGLYGPRGYIEALGKDHLTARRVVDLDQLRR